MEREGASHTKRVADVIRLRIMSGEIPAGSRINEVGIATELGMSRGPVREAVSLLVSEGLLVHRRNLGAAVPRLEPGQITALFELRAALECHAAELAAARATEDEIVSLRELCQLSNDVWHEGIRFPFQLDLRFHTALMRAAHSPMLSRNGLLVHQQVVQVRAGIRVPSAHTVSSMDDHQRITRAIARHDGERARNLMGDHLARVAHQFHSASQANQ